MTVVKFMRFLSALEGFIGPLVGVPAVVTVFGHPELLQEGTAGKDLYRITFALGNAGNPNITDV